MKKVSEITFQKRIQNEAFWRPTWDPKGSQDGSLIHIFSDPNGTTIRLIRAILEKPGPNAIGSLPESHLRAEMEPSWPLLGIGKDGKQMQKSKRNDSYQSSWYKTRAVYAAMHSQTQKDARFTFLLSQVFVDCF